MSQPASPESPRPGVERSTGGLVLSLYLAAAAFLLYLGFRVLVAPGLADETPPVPPAGSSWIAPGADSPLAAGSEPGPHRISDSDPAWVGWSA
jgi:hypothetical protein